MKSIKAIIFSKQQFLRIKKAHFLIEITSNNFKYMGIIKRVFATSNKPYI